MNRRGNDSLNTVLALLRCHQPCTARQITQTECCPVSISAAKALLTKMHQHGVVECVGKASQSYLYQLTGVAAYGTCLQCRTQTPVWNLREGQCSYCHKSTLGTNQQLASDFAFLTHPAFQLIHRVFRPWEDA